MSPTVLVEIGVTVLGAFCLGYLLGFVFATELARMKAREAALEADNEAAALARRAQMKSVPTR